MGLYSFKLTNAPNQTSTVSLTLGDVNKTFQIKLSYREIPGYWTMDLRDIDGEKDILTNAPLLTGGCLTTSGNMLAQFGYLDLGQMGVLPIVDSTTDSPDSKNIGTDYLLYWRYKDS